MRRCEECGNKLSNGVCEQCGLVCEDQHEYRYNYPVYDKEEKKHHGGLIRQNVSHISVMTHTNPNECHDSDLKRALKWDGFYGWGVQKVEIIFREIRRVCGVFDLRRDFIEKCFYFFKKHKDELVYKGRSLEEFAHAIVYTVMRLNKKPYTIYDFYIRGFGKRKIYMNYAHIIKSLGILKDIQPQDYEVCISRIVTEILGKVDFKFKGVLVKTIAKFYRIQNKTMWGDISTGSGLYVIAAWIYIICNASNEVDMTQDLICEKVGCSSVTLRKYKKKIKKFYDKWSK